MYQISLDAMGGDYGLSVVVPAAIKALQQYDDISLILVGDENKIKASLAENKITLSERLHLHHASQFIAMDESPALALRTKKDSSMRVAIDLVKNKMADAVVSAGNTGALMAIGRFVLKMLPGIKRPAICTKLPSLGGCGHTHMLDLGANVDSSAASLYQFAVMGSELAYAIDDIVKPRVGLLNVGQEALKGNEQVKAAHKLLAKEKGSLNYIGFVEGDDIFHGDVDVVVCDGFVGNIALKTTEGIARMINDQLKIEFKQNILRKISALVASPVLKALQQKFDPRRHNGASLLGLKGIVIKSHGGADSLAYANAIGIARAEIKKQVPQRIHEKLASLLTKGK